MIYVCVNIVNKNSEIEQIANITAIMLASKSC